MSCELLLNLFLLHTAFSGISLLHSLFSVLYTELFSCGCELYCIQFTDDSIFIHISC